MRTESILPDKLREFDYYVQKLPIYLQNSYGFIEHFRIWYEVLMGNVHTAQINSSGVVGSADSIFEMLNIFDQTVDSSGNITNKYLENLSKYENIGDTTDSKYGTKSDILDKLGELFGVRRSFMLSYKSYQQDQDVSVWLDLNNEEYLILIKAQIVKNYCDGSFEQLVEYYENIGLHVYITTETSAGYYATSRVNMVENPKITDNIRHLFSSGLLFIKSMGISYILTVSATNTLFWWNENSGDAMPDVRWNGGKVIDGVWVDNNTGGSWE